MKGRCHHLPHDAKLRRLDWQTYNLTTLCLQLLVIAVTEALKTGEHWRCRKWQKVWLTEEHESCGWAEKNILTQHSRSGLCVGGHVSSSVMDTGPNANVLSCGKRKEVKQEHPMMKSHHSTWFCYGFGQWNQHTVMYCWFRCWQRQQDESRCLEEQRATSYFFFFTNTF